MAILNFFSQSMEKAEKEQEERPAQVRNINYYTPMPMYYPGGQGAETKAAAILLGIRAVARVEIPEVHLADLEAVPAITLL